MQSMPINLSGLRALRDVTQLQTLDLEGCPNINDEGMHAIADTFPVLQELTISCFVDPITGQHGLLSHGVWDYVNRYASPALEYVTIAAVEINAKGKIGSYTIKRKRPFTLLN